MTQATSATPPGCTGSSTDPAVLPAGRRAARHPARAVARRGAHPGGEAQPRRRVVPPAGGHAHGGRRRGRRGGSARRGARHRRATRGKMQNPVTGSGGMLVGTVEEVGPESPLGLAVGRPGRHPGLAHPDPAGHRGRPGAAGTAAASRCPATGTPSCSAARSRRSLPDDLDPDLALSVMDVCGAPALTARVVERYVAERPGGVTVAVVGGAGKSGSLSLAAARAAGAAPHHRRGAARGGGGAAARAPVWPTTWSSPTPATRSRCATRSSRPAARPT